MKEKHYLVVGCWNIGGNIETEVYSLSHNKEEIQKAFNEQVLNDKDFIGCKNCLGANWEIIVDEDYWFEAKDETRGEKIITKIETI